MIGAGFRTRVSVEHGSVPGSDHRDRIANDRGCRIRAGYDRPDDAVWCVFNQRQSAITTPGGWIEDLGTRSFVGVKQIFFDLVFIASHAGFEPRFVCQQLRVLAHDPPNVGDHVLAHRQRHVIQLFVGQFCSCNCAVYVRKQILAVANLWCWTRRFSHRWWLDIGTMADAFPLAQLRHHIFDDGFYSCVIHGHSSRFLSYLSSPSTSSSSTIAMMTPSQGRLSVNFVWRAALPVA